MQANAALTTYESGFLIITNAETFCAFAFDNKDIQSRIMQRKVLFTTVFFLFCDSIHFHQTNIFLFIKL